MTFSLILLFWPNNIIYNLNCIKGLIHPECSVITHPHVVLNTYNFSSSLENKWRYFYYIIFVHALKVYIIKSTFLRLKKQSFYSYLKIALTHKNKPCFLCIKHSCLSCVYQCLYVNKPNEKRHHIKWLFLHKTCTKLLYSYYCYKV